jgi:hypothetical protein
MGDSKRFSKRGSDKPYSYQLKGGEWIFKACEANLETVLQLVNFKACKANLEIVLQLVYEEHILFCVASEIAFDTWYNVFLSVHFCECPDRESTCKHVL